MTFIIVGASAGLGRALAEKFASEGNNLIIISSELKDVNAIKCDLENRFNVEVFTTQMMFQKNELNFDDFDEIIKNVEISKGYYYQLVIQIHRITPTEIDQEFMIFLM